MIKRKILIFKCFCSILNDFFILILIYTFMHLFKLKKLFLLLIFFKHLLIININNNSLLNIFNEDHKEKCLLRKETPSLKI